MDDLGYRCGDEFTQTLDKADEAWTDYRQAAYALSEWLQQKPAGEYE